jgi:hypothetical protein
MGLFSSVIHVRDVDADSVCKALTDIIPNWRFKLSEERAMIGPPDHSPAGGLLYAVSPLMGQWSTILEAHGFIQEAPPLHDLAKSLSVTLATYTLALVVHDDDILFYNLYHKGDSLDGYNSNPQYFENERLSDDSIRAQRHDPSAFIPILPKGVSSDHLQALLDSGWWSAYNSGRLDKHGMPLDDTGFVFEGERMIEFGNLLQLHGRTEDYPFAGWAESGIEWSKFRELRFQRA